MRAVVLLSSVSSQIAVDFISAYQLICIYNDLNCNEYSSRPQLRMTPTASNGIQQAMAAYLLLRRAAIEDIGGSTEILHEAHRAKGIESSWYIAIFSF